MQLSDYFKHYNTDLSNCIQTAVATDANEKSLDVFDAFASIISHFRQAHEQGGKIVFLGNGGSAAIASHQAYDYWKNGKLRAVCFNDAAHLTGSSNDFGHADIFSRPLEMFTTDKDVIVAISSSGRSPNIVNAAREGQRIGCHVVTLSAFGADNPLRSSGDINIYLNTSIYGHAEIGHLTILHTLLDHTIYGETA